MPWYRFNADHGPGHQSHAIKYEYYREPLSKSERREEWDRLFDDKDWPVGRVRIIKAIPEYNKRSRISDCYYELKHAKFMLKVLKKTKTLREKIIRKCRHLRKFRRSPSHSTKDLCVKCHNWVDKNAKY